MTEKLTPPPPYPPNVRLENYAFGGEAIGHMPDGRVVFVPYGLKDDLVSLRVVEDKPKYARAEILEILEPAPNRIAPRCPHFGTCGGCHYQALAYTDQLTLKRQIVRDQLARIGKITDPAVEPVFPSPSEWNYRSTVQFHPAPNGKMAFQSAGGRSLVQISECHLPLIGINDLWPELEIDPAVGIERVMIREGTNDDLLLGMESRGDAPPDFEVDFPISVVFLGQEDDLLLSGEPYTIMSVRDVDFIVSARSFFQVNAAVAAAMVDFVLENAGLNPSSVVMDLFCGVGLFSRFIAPLVSQLIGIEISESACNDFAANLDPFDNVSLYVGAVEDVLPGLEVLPDLVILDPPRSGLPPQVHEQLVNLHPARIIYISCDPTTLARDAKKLLAEGYSLLKVKPFDQFPQTYHIESVSVFQKAE